MADSLATSLLSKSETVGIFLHKVTKDVHLIERSMVRVSKRASNRSTVKSYWFVVATVLTFCGLTGFFMTKVRASISLDVSLIPSRMFLVVNSLFTRPV